MAMTGVCPTTSASSSTEQSLWTQESSEAGGQTEPRGILDTVEQVDRGMDGPCRMGF